jgi:hypothetical protein
MRCLNSRVSTVGIFFAATALLIVYLLSIRWHIYLPVAVFWVAIALMIGTILYQVLRSELSPSYVKVVLLEIAVTCLVFHLIYQIPYYGLRGSDAYIDLASAKAILSTGFVKGDPQYFNGTAHWPMIHILGVQLSLITGIDLLSTAKWFPFLLGIALVPLLYLLVRAIFKKETIALLSALMFICLQHHILFSSLFVRETIAIVLMVCCLYLCFSARSSGRLVTYYVLLIVCSVGVILGHHLTSFMLAIFLFAHFLVTNGSELPLLRRRYLGDNVTGEKIPVSFMLFTIVAITAYWLGVVMEAHDLGDILFAYIKSLFDASPGLTSYAVSANIASTSLQTIRGYILYYGFYFFMLTFVIILLYGLIPRLRAARIEALSFSLFVFICGIGGLIALYVQRYWIVPYPDRFLMFGWLIGFPPLVATIMNRKHRLFRRIGIVLLAAFMLFNIYQIEPIAWDARYEDVPSATSEEDYALANALDFSTGEIAANAHTPLAIYDIHNNLARDVLSNINLSQYEWVVVQKEALRLEQKWNPQPRTEAIAGMEQLNKEGSPERNKIYESNNLSVFKLREPSYE